MQMIKTSMQPKFPSWSSPLPQARAGATTAGAEGFSKYAEALSGDFNPYAHIPLSEIKTKMVEVETVNHDGTVTKEIKEMAVCPECGETNCACLAQVTLQARLDEENAKGVRNAEKPNPMSIIPQSFNQISLNLSQNKANVRFR